MWNNKELKKKARDMIQKNYVQVLIVSVIIAFFGGSFISVSYKTDTSNYYNYGTSYEEDITNIMNGTYEINNDPYDITEHTTVKIGPFSFEDVFKVTYGTMAIIGLFSMVYSLLIGYPLAVGQARFYIDNCYEDEKPEVKRLLFGFQKEHYSHFIITEFLIGLRLFLWFLLLIIPGIIKAYEYYMTDHLLADYPELTAEQAISYSKKMMDGNKWDAFVLVTISILPWHILSIITSGLAGILYVDPYTYSIKTELYLYLKEKYQIDYELGYSDQPVFNYEQTDLDM